MTQDTAGQSETVAGYDVALLGPAGDLRQGGAALRQASAVPPSSFAGYALAGLLEGFAPGPYRLQVRARDTAGHIGQWSEPLPVTLDGSPPGVVTGLRVVVQVSVTVGQ